MQLPSEVRTCLKKFLFWILFSEVGSIGLTTAACQCHVHVRSDEVYVEARCNSQAFELVLMKTFLFSRIRK